MSNQTHIDPMNSLISNSVKLTKIPTEYYVMRKTKKELFMMYLKRAMNKVKR